MADVLKSQKPMAWPKAPRGVQADRPDLQFSTHERSRVATGDPYATSAINEQDRQRTETPRPRGGAGAGGRR